MKKIIKLLVSVLVILVLITYASQFFHVCDGCDSFFIGSGYEPNALADMINAEDELLCKECAEVHHIISLGLGEDLSEFRKPFELNPFAVIGQWFN